MQRVEKFFRQTQPLGWLVGSIGWFNWLVHLDGSFHIHFATLVFCNTSAQEEC